MGKVIHFRNPESAASTDWIGVERHLVELVLTVAHVQNDAMPGAVVDRLADISNHAANGRTLDRQLLQNGYNPVIDDSIDALMRRILAEVQALRGYVHDDYLSFMERSCANVLEGTKRRRAACGMPQQQRMERAA